MVGILKKKWDVSMSVKGRERVLSENITGVTEELQNALVFKRYLLQELKVRVGSPIGVMGNLQRDTESPPSEPEPQSCAGQHFLSLSMNLSYSSLPLGCLN